ncbi:MAG: kelch repeat-containing protein [Planctomycetota bacterium]
MNVHLGFRRPSLLLALLGSAASAVAQLPLPTLTLRAAPRATWTSVVSAGTTTPAGTPPTVPNFNTTFRADSCGAASNDAIYVFGGSLGNNTSTVTNDLWAFNGLAGTFTQLQPHGAVGAPPARSRHTAAWNPQTQRLVVFGGNTRGLTPTLLNDIWEYDPSTNTWTDVTPVSGSPSPRQFASMTYDPLFQGMLLFGGQTNDAAPNVNSSETWVFVGGAWAQLSPGTVPAARGQHSLVTRSDFGDVLMLGGLDAGIAAPDQIKFLDVWVWNGDWTKISDCDVLTNPTGSGTTWPGSANANQAVYDPLRKRVVVQGGNGITVAANTTYVYGPNYGGSPTNFTSEFDCLTNSWVLYGTGTFSATAFNNNDPQIGRISRYFGGYLASTGKVYKVCGQNAAGSSSKPTYNVYAYQANPVADAVAYGNGCTGPGGLLSLTADNLPWTGRNFDVTVTGLGVGSLPVWVVGFTQWNFALNSLLPEGLPGCEALTSPDVQAFLPFATGAPLQLSLPIPPTASLAGAPFFMQVADATLDPFFTLISLASTNGLAGTVGAL